MFEEAALLVTGLLEEQDPNTINYWIRGPNKIDLDTYPALKDAWDEVIKQYEQYQLIAKLTLGDK